MARIPQDRGLGDDEILWSTYLTCSTLGNKLEEVQMASVVKRRRKNGETSWYARYRDGRGKDVWEQCASARDARARAAEVKLLLARTGNA